MPFVREKLKDYLLILLYVLALLAPGICMLFTDFGLASITKLVLALVFLIVWHLAFKNLVQSMYFSLFFFALLPFDLFFFSIYLEPPTTPVLLSIGNTNVSEALDFMHGRVALLLVIVTAVIAIWLQAVHTARRGVGEKWRYYNPATRHMSRLLIVFMTSALGIFAFGPSLTHKISQLGMTAPASLVIRSVDERVATVIVKLKGIFPVGRFISAGEYYREEANFSYAEQSRNTVRFNAKQTDAPEQRQIYVLVIGESARADHSQLNGYVRETSPLLMKQSNLIALHDVISPWSLTRPSVPTIVTGQQSSANGGQLKSIVSAFREAGFKTYWLSNQEREYGISHYAREANEPVFLSVSALVMQRNGNYDENLLVPMEKILNREEPRQFFVLHLLGSHDAYEKRYPSSFDVFQPSLTTNPDLDYHDSKNKVQVVNTYDNTIRYTDFVLSNIIAAIQKRHGVSALMYSSDHGETLFDGSCPRSGHGGSSRYEFAVNALSWVSDEHKNRWPDKYRLLKKNGNAPLTTEFIFETMLGLANVTTNHRSQQRNLVGAGFQPEERWVNGQDLINWDTAGTKGLCSLLTSEARR